MKQAVFLDKDGTLIEDVPYNVDPAKIRLMPGAGSALRAMEWAGYELIVVTNQSGVARGYFREQALAGVEDRLREMFAAEAVRLAGFYYCPHHPEGTVGRYAVACGCRKPAPGMLFRAAVEHQIDLNGSWLVGDILHDVEAGRRAGCRTILVDNGGETEWELAAIRRPHYLVGDLMSAADVIAGSRIGAERAQVTLRDLVARVQQRREWDEVVRPLLDPAVLTVHPSGEKG